ncbi:hypothetical protein EJ04DRAFT_145402 [Polyplosphaeria fusca]|uniref:Thioredoxin domain-containing protein n=1 Tax=Polyplosphaeria fusca TaxID=682080 RepID=A0A9P4QLM3_9PLEO|nr:hypothetical protein EJ04DRAFT_145402 [Polyplosphaeria fusca]
MSWQTEFRSWSFPVNLSTPAPPVVGSRAPHTEKLSSVAGDGRPFLVTFLRHCGCPFAEKTFMSLRKAASEHPDTRFIAVSHSDDESTRHWVDALGGAEGVLVVVDASREAYASWGLGVSSFWHVLNPWSLYSVYKLGKQENIWNRPTESGSRWQCSGSFAVNEEGTVRWSSPSQTADHVPDFAEAVQALSTK